MRSWRFQVVVLALLGTLAACTESTPPSSEASRPSPSPSPTFREPSPGSDGVPHSAVFGPIRGHAGFEMSGVVRQVILNKGVDESGQSGALRVVINGFHSGGSWPCNLEYPNEVLLAFTSATQWGKLGEYGPRSTMPAEDLIEWRIGASGAILGLTSGDCFIVADQIQLQEPNATPSPSRD